MNNAEPTMPNFNAQELTEIKKWAEVIGYQGNARDLETALALNREIVAKCEAGLGEWTNRKNGYTEDTAELG